MKTMMMRLAVTNRRFSHSFSWCWVNSCATYSSEPRVLNPSSKSHHSDAGYEGLLRVLEACKLVPNLETATAVHATIFKNGYEKYPSLLSLLICIYVTSKCQNLACKLLEEICYQNVDVVSANSMISNLMKVGEICVAKKIFHNVPSRDVVTWNSLIGGFVKNACFQEALGAFREMLKTKIEPDRYTFASTITACARLGALDHAKWVHGMMVEKSIELNHILASALIDMYAKCGKIDIAKEIFNAVQRTDVSIWNAMIKALAIHGLAFEAIAIFSMMEAEKSLPDSITFIELLIACSHCGLVDQGRKLFDMMNTFYMIQPQLEHYGAMVDLLSRAGLLEEAYGVIKDMTVKPDTIIWRTLLSACRTHKNTDLAEVAFSNLKQFSGGDYALLSNMYCSVKKWDSSEKVRHMMKEKSVRKSSGKSWLEIGGVIHQFSAGGKSHHEINKIYKVLEALINRTRIEGYTFETDLVLMDVSEEEKEENLSYHSEKLALAYGILKTSPGTEILISKNLRICSDCHSWMKIISKLLNRVILVRDRIRFHRFEGGTCTCRDYW